MVSHTAGPKPIGRALASLSQVQTYLTLVEQGSVSSVSALLGLGPSTISAHVKALEDELGHRLFDRLHGGMVPTQAGREAFLRFRPLLARAAFCLGYVRSRSTRAPQWIDVVVPEGFAGTVFDAALRAATHTLRESAPHLCLLPREPGAATKDEASLRVRYGSSSDPKGGPMLRDQWVVVRASASPGWRGRPLALSALAGLPLLVPDLSDSLRRMAAALGAHADIRLSYPDLPLGRMLSQSGEFQNFCALVPAGLLADAVERRAFEFASVEPGPYDPWVSMEGGPPDAADALHQELCQRLGAPRGSRDSLTLPDAAMLPLKLARSFLALYEEGHVGRAAQRLCLVQPALTVQLRQIEERVAAPLFARTHQGLRATASADVLYGLLCPLIEDFDAAVNHLRATGAPRARPLRIGLMPALDDESLMTESFVSALERWTRTHDADVPQVVEAYSGTLVRWVHEGRVDFAVIDQAISDAMLETDKVAADSMAVVVGAGSNLLPSGPVALREIAKLPLVLPSPRHGLRALLTRTLKEIDVVLEPKAEVDSMAAALRLVKVAPYATVLPLGTVYKSRRRRRLRVHEICEPRIIRDICLTRARRGPPSDGMLDLMHELRSAFHRNAAILDRSAGFANRLSLAV
jgi:DNA-binding transcriptional LysR family regulator